jgi:hypothetical protein
VFQYTTEAINDDKTILHKRLMAVPERVETDDNLAMSATGGCYRHCEPPSCVCMATADQPVSCSVPSFGTGCGRDLWATGRFHIASGAVSM